MTDNSSEQQQVASGSRLTGLVELIPAAVYSCEAPSGRINFYNAHAARLWGREPRIGDVEERFCGSFRLWRPDGSPLAHADTPMAIALREGRPTRNGQIVIERPDGSRITVLVNVDPIFDDSGRLLGAVNVFQDTTELRRVEEERARLAAIVESSDDAIISKNLDGIITSWNDGAERLFGYTAAEAIGRSVTMLIPLERHDEEPSILDRVRRGDRVHHYETVRLRKDGSHRHISLTISPVRDAAGNVIGASKIARDITDRKEAAARAAFDSEAMTRLYQIGNRSVRPGAEFLDILAQMLDAAIWITHADRGNVQLYEERSGALRIAVHRGFDRPFLEFFDTVGPEMACACGSALGREGSRVVVEDVTTSSIFAGQPSLAVLLEAGVRAEQSTPLVSSAGAVIGMVSTHFSRPHRPSEYECRLLDLLARQMADYVERKRGEEQREELLRATDRARREAESANRAKDEFLAMLGHELRNPLSAIRNAVATAQLDEGNRARALSIASRQADQLARIVDDLLDVARITRGTVVLRKERVALADVLQRAADGARATMDERGHTLTVSVGRREIYLEADAARLEQAVGNLLANAAKYTEPGGTMSVVAQEQEGEAVIRVRDDGIGIAEEMLPRVFDPFVQGQRALDRAEGGLGIGLTLVRRIAELHGGSVEATSPGPGGGAEFTIRLPGVEAAAELPAPAVKQARRGEVRAARVLMVEDNRDAAESLLMILEILGHHVRVVHDGSTALAAAQANVPDLMLIDIGLPGMNGYEIAQAVRRADDLKHVLLVALTGYGRPEDKARAMAAGFDYHLVKPVDLDALGELVGRLAPQASRSAAGPPAEIVQ